MLTNMLRWMATPTLACLLIATCPCRAQAEDYSTTSGLSVGVLPMVGSKGGFSPQLDVHATLMLITAGVNVGPDLNRRSGDEDCDVKSRFYLGPSFVGVVDLTVGMGDGTSVRGRGNIGWAPFDRTDHLGSIGSGTGLSLGFPSDLDGRQFRSFLISPVVEYNFKYHDLMGGLALNVVIW